MEIFIAGATGVLGRRLVRQFLSSRHTVTGLARSEENVRLIESLGAKALRADIFDAAALARAAAGAQVIIHAATAIPTQARIRPSDWALNDRLRRNGTQALAEAAARVGALVYIQQSIVWVARPRSEAQFDEDSPVQTHPVYDSAADGEHIAHGRRQAKRISCGRATLRKFLFRRRGAHAVFRRGTYTAAPAHRRRGQYRLGDDPRR